MRYYDDYDSDYDYDRAQERREALADARADRISEGECVCRGGAGPYDREGGPDYWAESDCPVHGDDLEDEDEDEL